MNTKTLNELTAIKLLLSEATRALEGAGIQRVFAILHAHDALDWTLQVIYAHPKIGGKKKSKMYLADYAREIDNVEPGIVDIGNVSRLNTLRVGFKHDLIFPDPEITKEMVLWVENQINTLTRRIFQLSLSDVDLLTAIENDNIKTKVTKADKEFSQGKITEAFCNLSIAFEMVKFDLQDNLEKVTGKRPVFRTDLGFSNSFFLHLDVVGHDFSRAWDQIVDGVEYLVDMSFVNSLGVNVSDYFQFQSVTPRPIRIMNGEYHCDISNKTAAKMKTSEYQKCRNFVIEAALKTQSKI